MSAEFSAESSGPGASQARAGDADRERVVDVLRAAAGDGRLTVAELDERLEAALSARTMAELARLTADLVDGSAAPGVATVRVEDVVRIDQRGGSVRRSGHWAVPRRLELRPSWCAVTLDFTDAVIAHDTLHIDLNMRGGSLVLVGGPCIAVDTGSLRVRYTNINIKTVDPAQAVLRVQLTGSTRYGKIETR